MDRGRHATTAHAPLARIRQENGAARSMVSGSANLERSGRYLRCREFRCVTGVCVCLVAEYCFADGHRRSIVEHTIHVLVLPGLHAGVAGRQQGPTAAGACASDSSLDVVSAHLYSLPHFQHTSQPALALPGTRVAWPSPLHMQLRVLSRLEFNGERVTHHRDFWGER